MIFRPLTHVALLGFTAMSLGGITLASGTGTAAAAGSYSTTAVVNVRQTPGTAGAYIRTEGQGTSFVLNCQVQNSTSVNGNRTWDNVRFADGTVGYITDYWTTSPSFNSFAPGTPDCNAVPTPPQPGVTAQMRAAANWAIAEKNSPDPTWSDHYWHRWSGWCEQFVEQAEGFTFRFGSATLDYQWAASHGRIHTDANPPVGALVFWGSTTPDGHVAISIGGGQAIGTIGDGKIRLPVSQYPVIGFVANYRGWALPIGS